MNLAPALIHDASSGDQQAFVLLVEPLLADAFRLAVGMLRSKSDAENAVQDGVLNALAAFRSVPPRFRPAALAVHDRGQRMPASTPQLMVVGDPV